MQRSARICYGGATKQRLGMYIKKIILKNIRCFEEIEIDLTSDDDVRKWAVILGDNGVGKTTLLRSIAIGLCDGTSASGLLAELYGDWPRKQSPKNSEISIKIEFKSKNKRRKSPFIKTIIKPLKSGYSKVEQKTFPDPFPWDDIFVCGYGAARRALGSKDYGDYAVTDAVYTLFNYDSPLQNPELIIRRLIDSENKEKISRTKISNMIDEILMLPLGSTRLTNVGIQIRGDWGLFTPLGALGDGYQATLAWIVDLLGWAFFYDAKMFKKELSGIVLLDEIEQHLHPRWQRRIIQKLKNQFPAIQFITTTHTPMCAIGTTDLTDAECQLVMLSRRGDRVDAIDKLKPPRGRRADQVLTSYMFGLMTTSDDQTKEEIEKYSYLLGKERTAEVNRELQALQDILDQKLGEPETELEKKVLKTVSQVLSKKPDFSKVNKKSFDYEVKRQLKKLFE